MKNIEKELVEIHAREGGGFLSQMDKDLLIRLEGRRGILLLEREDTWRLKSRATWLECGDDNTKFFRAYARGRKVVDTVRRLIDDQGVSHDTFEGMDNTRVEQFKSLYKEPAQESIAEVIRVVELFPRFVEEEDNLALMEEVTEEELKGVLQSFQKDKSLGPYGWSIEFFLELYEILGEDLLKVVEDTRLLGRLPVGFN